MVSFEDNGKQRKYTFNINESIINFTCTKSLGTDYCEEMINKSLKEKSAVVAFEGDRVKSIQALSLEKNSQVSCLANAKKTQLECSKRVICESDTINIDAILDQRKASVSINECNNASMYQCAEALSFAKSLSIVTVTNF